MADKPKYIKCPRCDLNYIPDTEELCDVCKAELNLLPDYTFLDDFEEDEMLCPVCHINYITGDEEMCSDCRLARAESINEDDDDSWREFLDEDTELEPETEEEVLLSQLQDEEFGEENDEEENDEYIDDDADYREYYEKGQNAVKARCEHCGHEALLTLKPRLARSVHVRPHDIA